MSLKQIIKERKILESGAVDMQLELPGEPLIYSIKYDVGKRHFKLNFWRDKKWRSMLKCYFRAYMRSKVPVVLMVTFYTTPPEWVDVKPADVESEKMPAVFSYEVCEYLLSFLEMLHSSLFNSYKQIVHLEVSKFYSTNPRTVFQFMQWSHYAQLQSKNPVHPKTKTKRASKQAVKIQPECYRYEADKGVCKLPSERRGMGAHEGPVAGYMPSSVPGAVRVSRKEAPKATPDAPCD